MLAQGRIPNAAEKAWGATKRATDALVLSRAGEEPERTPETGHGLGILASLDESVRDSRLPAATTAGRSRSTVCASTTASATHG